MKFYILKNNNRGFIALISTIIISAVLIVLTFTVSQSGFFSRHNSLDSELKRISKSMAESCVNQALLDLAENPNMLSVTDKENSSVGCKYTIEAPTFYDSNYKKIVKITASAKYPDENGTFSKVEVSTTIYNPKYSPPSKIVVKVFSYGNGAKSPDEFGPFKINETIIDLNTTTSFINPGTYSVSETTDPDYTTSFSGDCDSAGDINLGINDYQTCNIINTLKPQTASLTVVISNDGYIPDLSFNDNSYPSQTSQKINISKSLLNSDGSNKTFSIKLGTINTSSYSVSHWAGTDCSGDYNNGSVTLRKGDNKVCAISLSKKSSIHKAALTVVTRVINSNGGKAKASDFTTNVNAISPSKQSESITDENKTTTYYVDPGAFNITEDNFGTYKKSYLNSTYPYLCQGTAIVGESYLCLITNTDTASTFTLTTAVNVTQAYKVTPAPNFTLALDSSDGHHYSVTSGEAISNLPPGTYAVSISDTGNYSVSAWGSSPDCSPTGIVTWTPGDKNYKNCVINLVENPPAFNNIDTLMMLDRTGSMFNTPSLTWIGGERIASKSLLDLFSGITPPLPQVGVGVFANDSNIGAKIAGNLTNDYGSETITSTSTSTLYPNGQGYYDRTNAWTNGESTIDETGTPNCSSTDSINTAIANNRESVIIDLSSIPDGSTLSSVDITVYDKANTTAGGTYKTFARLNGSNIDSTSTLSASSTSGTNTCSLAKKQTITFATTVKSSTTTLEIGVMKTSGNNNSVRVGSINAVVNYSGQVSTKLYLAINSNLALSRGGTDLSSAINTANTELNSTRHISGHKKYLILLSDGEPTLPVGGGSRITQGDIDAAYVAADSAKTNKGTANDFTTEIYTIHFGNVTTLPSGYTSRDLMAKLATGTVANGSHQPGSNNDKTTIDAENNDGDHFFIVPTTADPTLAMTYIFNKIGQQIIEAETPPTATMGTLNVITHVITNNTNHVKKYASDFEVTVTESSKTETFAGTEAPGKTIILNPGTFNVTESTDSDYVKTIDTSCEGEIAAGQEITCIIINDDSAPSNLLPTPEPPPPPPSVNLSPVLVVVTQINNGSGTASKSSNDFEIGIDNPYSKIFPGSETGELLTLTPGNYNVTPEIDSQYSKSKSTDCEGTIANFETKTCVIIYTANPPTPPPIDMQQNIDINSWQEVP